MALLESCKLCPRNCGANRLGEKRGFCGAGGKNKGGKSCPSLLGRTLYIW